MSNESNTHTQDALKDEIKTLKANCINTCHIIENTPPNAPIVDPEEFSHQVDCYIKGLQDEVQNMNTPICTDDNLLTSQFLNEIKEKTGQLDQLTAYTKGAIHDVDAEISRLKNLISTAKESLSKPKITKQEVHPEHIERAKDRFQMMKNELQGLMQSLFPRCYEEMKDLMGKLMAAKMDNNQGGYIQITNDDYQLIEILKELNIVTPSPYNNMQVKLAYY